VAALWAWSGGDLLTAGAHWEAILLDYPTDILALRLQHFATFWTGNSVALRDGMARALPAWDERTPGYSYVLGMYAFGLEEAGEYAMAEARGKHAVELNPDDLWAIHAVAHVLEMQGRCARAFWRMVKAPPRRLSMACYLYAMIMPVSAAATHNAMSLPSS
jgi:hypothetical protein